MMDQLAELFDEETARDQAVAHRLRGAARQMIAATKGSKAKKSA
jgi:hypothetical protein